MLLQQIFHIEIISTQRTISFHIVFVQFILIVYHSGRTFFDANLKCLAQFFDIEKEQIGPIDCVQSGQFKV